MNDPLPTPVAPGPGARPAPVPLRALRALVLLALCSVIAFLFVLAAVAVLNPFTDDDEHFRLAVRVTLFIALGLPLLLIWAAYRLRLRSWWWLGGGWLALLPVLAYLAADDPVIRRPMTIEELAPAFPGAERSYEVLMRYAKDAPAAQAFKVSAFAVPREADEIPAFAEANRARIDTTWEELSPIRQWYAELAAFDRIGDLAEARYDAPVPAFPAHRILGQVAQLKAMLLAADGRGDEAIATLLPVLEVSWKIQVTSRSLVRSTIGFTVRRMAIDAADYTLGRTPVSPEMRARLLAALGPAGGEAGARWLVAIEYAYWTTGSTTDYHLGPDSSVPAILRLPFGLVAPLLINRNRTINEAGDIMAELQDLAARRQPMNSPRLALAGLGPLSMKNLGGQLVVFSSLPAFQTITDRYWQMEDRLAALRARLASS